MVGLSPCRARMAAHPRQSHRRRGWGILKTIMRTGRAGTRLSFLFRPDSLSCRPEVSGMRWPGWVLAAGLCLGGCASPVQERVRDYNLDGLHLFQQGDYAAARESFQAALDLEPGNPT